MFFWKVLLIVMTLTLSLAFEIERFQYQLIKHPAREHCQFHDHLNAEYGEET